MYVTAWSNGSGGYGFKIAEHDRDRFFDRGHPRVVLELTGQGEIVVALSPSFWRTCRELRSAQIGRWLRINGLAPWPNGRPPKVLMEHAGDDRFTVRLLPAR